LHPANGVIPSLIPDYRGEWRALDDLDPLGDLRGFDFLDGFEDFDGSGLELQTSV
jgi:hypothetical protein